MKTYLRLGSDTLDEARRYPSKKSAIAAYAETARELARYSQPIEASLHYAEKRDTLHEYPDYILSLSPRGAVRCERT
jgi:hypothetical protein